jgi:hypothetical protein
MTRVFAGASEKRRAGKTNIIATLVFALSKLRKNVVVMDADLGLHDATPHCPATSGHRDLPPRVDSARHIRSESRQAAESRRRIVPQCPSQPCLSARSHGDLCIATDNLAKRPASIVLAAAILLKDES